MSRRSATLRLRRALLVLLLASVLAASGCFTLHIGAQDILRPRATVTPRDFPTLGFSLDERTIPVGEGVTIDLWHLRRERPRATVLYFGGIGFLMVGARPWIERFATLDVDVVLHDYRGSGRSEGCPTVAAMLADSERVHQFVIDELGVDPRRLILHGYSMGTFLAAKLASEHTSAGLVLENPVTSAQGWGAAHIPWVGRPFVNLEFEASLEELDNVEAVRALDEPLLVLTGDDDMIAPPEMAAELFDAAPVGGKWIEEIPGGKHDDLPCFPSYLSAYAVFLAAAVPSTAPVARTSSPADLSWGCCRCGR